MFAYSEFKNIIIYLPIVDFSDIEDGYSNYGNFVSLVRDRNEEMMHSMNSETTTFPKELIR